MAWLMSSAAWLLRSAAFRQFTGRRPVSDHPSVAEPAYDGPDLLTALPEDVKVQLAVRVLSPVEVARLACTCHAWRSFVQSVGVWRLKHAALGVGPALAEDVTTKVALEALYKALDAACVVTPAAQCDFAWKDHEQHWSLAQHLQHPFVSEILNGSLCPSEVMLLRMVWWFDICSAFSLPPGIWLLRFRVKMHQIDQLRNLQVKVEVEDADAACDVCIQLGDHWPRSPHDVSDVDETVESIQSASPCKRVQCPVRRMVMSSDAVQHGSGPIVRATGNALNTWLYVTAAVVHIPARPGRTGVRMRARLFDHSSGTMYIGWAVDALQAIPLHDPTRWPLPGKAALELEGCHL